jgi:membrane associated rhomboid family serine protease
MLSDRPYLRGDYEREKTSALTWLLSALVAGSVVQWVIGAGWIGGGTRVEDYFGLSVRALQQGWVWTLLTHSFLHSPTFVLHLLFNLLALYFLGRELLPMLGTPRFLGLFAAANIVGGLAWSVAHWGNPAQAGHLGATAAVDALFVVFACFFPNQQITFLLFFVFPVTLKPKHVATFLAGFALITLFVFELPGAPLPLDLALSSSAHLGGMLAGLLYYRFIHDSRWSFGSPDRAEMELPRWLKRTRREPAPAAVQVNVEPAPTAPDRESIRAEVDRILDKINSQGFGALTAEERRMLDSAKDLLSRR